MVLDEILNAPEAQEKQISDKVKLAKIAEPEFVLEDPSPAVAELKTKTRQRKAFICWSILNKFPEGKNNQLFEASEKEVAAAIRELAFRDGSGTKLNSREKSFLFQECIDDLLGFGAVESILRDSHVSKFTIYSPAKAILKRNGSEIPVPLEFKSLDALKAFGNRIDKLAQLNYEKSSEQVEDEYFYRGWTITRYDFPEKANLPFLCFIQKHDQTVDLKESELHAKFPMALTLNRSSQVDENKLRDRTRFISNLIKRDFPALGANVKKLDYEKITRRIRQLVYSDSPGETMSSLEKSLLFQDCLDEIFGFGPLGPVVRDPMISNIFIFADGKLAVNNNLEEMQPVSIRFDDTNHVNRTIGKLLENFSANPEIKDDTENYSFRNFTLVLKKPPYDADEPFCIIKLKPAANV